MKIELKQHWRTGPPTTVVKHESDVPGLLAQLGRAPFVALDTETSGLDITRDSIYYWSLCFDPTSRYVLPVHLLPYFRDFLQRTDLRLLLWNYKYDRHLLANHGIDLRSPLVLDGMVLHWLLRTNDYQPHKLKDVARKEYRIPMRDFREVFPTGSILDYSIEEGADYASLDSWGTYIITLDLVRKSRKVQTRILGEPATLFDTYWRVDRPAMLELWKMERRGIQISEDHLVQGSQQAEKDLDRIERTIAHRAGQIVNVGSPPQVARLLYNHYGLLPFRQTATGGDSTDFDTLQQLCDMGVEGMLSYAGYQLEEATPEEKDRIQQGVEICRLIQEHRTISKNLGTYMGYQEGSTRAPNRTPKQNETRHGLREWADTRGRIHPTFWLLINTSRTSCFDPNLQNIPVDKKKDVYRIRGAFVPTPGYLLGAGDYGQIEIRVLAHYCRDPALLAAIRGGKDIHCFCAALMFGEDYEELMMAKRWDKSQGPPPPRIQELQWLRYAIKTISFALIYGAGEYRILGELTSMGKAYTLAEVGELMRKYFNTFPRIKGWLDHTVQECADRGYVTTLFGHRRYLPDIASADFGRREHAERCAGNTPIQGSACGILKRAIAGIGKSKQFKELGGRMLLQVHDEVVFEAPLETAEQASACLVDLMDHPPGVELLVPLGAEAKLAQSWLGAK